VMVPATLKDLLTARLDRMAPEARKVVQVGSTIGREFSYELLRDVLLVTSRRSIGASTSWWRRASCTRAAACSASSTP